MLSVYQSNSRLIVLTVYQDLESLSAHISKCIQTDNEKIDLLTSFKDSSELLQADNLFKHEKTIPFPECIIERIEEPDCPCKMGFLPILKRTWLSAGKTLFIWDKPSDIFIYSSQDIIENVFVVDINQESKYGLMVATGNRLFLHEISFEANNEIKIHSNTSLVTYNVVMMDVVKGVNHRYFLKGSDGHLFELEVPNWEKSHIGYSASLFCRTERPLMRYLPSFFKSEPEARVKSVAVDINNALLYLLLNDSTIHVITIAGKTYITNSKYKGKQLESLHAIPETESDTICLMAVTNTAERLYFKNVNNVLEVVHTEKAPSVHGALLFNHQSNEKVDLTYYHEGVFAAVLSKSEKSILVFAASEWTGENKILPSYSQENITNKVWSIMESDYTSRRSYLKSSAEMLKEPHRKMSILSAGGISIYEKQKPVDILKQILSIQSVKGIERFLSIYGSRETSAMCLALTASGSDCHAAIDQFMKSHDKMDGLMIYFSRLVSLLWSASLEELRVDDMTVTKNEILHLKQTLEKFEIDLQDDLKKIIVLGVQGIQLLCFIHQRGWDTIVSNNDTKAMVFSNWISTDKGAHLVKKLIMSTIYALKPGEENSKCAVSGFLKDECATLAGKVSLLFYQGMEHLQNVKNGFKQEIQDSLHYFLLAKDILSLDELKGIVTDYCSFDFHLGAVKLINEKYSISPSLRGLLNDSLFQVFKHALDKSDEYGQQTLQTVLSNNTEQDYHYKIYEWLIKTDQLLPLINLRTDFIVPYLETSLPEYQGLGILWQYHEHKGDFDLAKSCLERLATRVDNIPLDLRVEYMDYAIECASKDKAQENKQEQERLTRIRDTAQVQFNLHKVLIEDADIKAKNAAASLVLQLKSIDVLLDQYAMVYNVYSEALCLIHLQRAYNFKYVKEAWKQITHQTNNSALLKAKIVRIGQRIYPSTYAFPVYVLVELLDDFVRRHELKDDLAMQTLCDVGVAKEVVLEARRILQL
ncbi:hypothetical protein K501DRAFT_331815 [Backusella circina FSU 941]|nr:hypothetical protein K501DRAFT_331815 [Backusella circina FSU 941]